MDVTFGAGDSEETTSIRLVMDFQAPDRLRACLSQSDPLGGIEFEFVRIGDVVYAPNPHTGEWEIGESSEVRVDFLDFIGDEIIARLEEPSVDGLGILNDAKVHRVTGMVTAAALGGTTLLRDFDLGGGGELKVVYWVGVDDSLVRRFIAEGMVERAGEEGVDLFMAVEVSDFGGVLVGGTGHGGRARRRSALNSPHRRGVGPYAMIAAAPAPPLHHMSIQERISRLLAEALLRAQRDEALPSVELPEPGVERTQKPEHGDFACALPLRLARPMRMSPMAIAERVVERIDADETIERAWVAPPGFVNFSLAPSWLVSRIEDILEAGPSYGSSNLGAGRRVQVEFVSVNPTGPLHVGHARGAVFGSALANVLEAAGYDVQREYYVNDAGNQIDTFGRSLLARYLQILGRDAPLPEDGYRGDYMLDLAGDLKGEVGDRFLDVDETRAAAELGGLGVNRMIDRIRADMADIRVTYDEWFSERSLYEMGQYDRAMELLRERGHLAERDGATWFGSQALGDNEDRVLVRRNGVPTYLASDVAYPPQQVRRPRLRPGDRRLGRRPPGTGALDEGGGQGPRRRARPTGPPSLPARHAQEGWRERQGLQEERRPRHTP